VRYKPLPSKRLECRYCGRAFAIPARAFQHREKCSAKKPAKAVAK
jgi:hypothetical protein